MADQKAEKKYWLFKSEPDVYGIDALEADGTTYWEGVRNYQARNLIRDDMAVGDQVLYYHSNAKPPGVAGLAEISRPGYPDPEQFDPDSKYYDSKSTEDDPIWFVVDVRFVARFERFVSLAELKAEEALDGMLVTKRGQRLSVQPVEKRHFERVLDMAGYGG